MSKENSTMLGMSQYQLCSKLFFSTTSSKQPIIARCHPPYSCPDGKEIFEDKRRHVMNNSVDSKGNAKTFQHPIYYAVPSRDTPFSS